MKFLITALVLSVVLTSPALAATGDPRLVQGTLEWPSTLSGEPFVILRGDDGRVYYADVTAAVRHTKGALGAGSRVALLGLEGPKPHEITAVAVGSGDAAALALALSQPKAPTPSTAPAEAVTPAPPAAPPTVAPPARVEGERWVPLRGTVHSVVGQTLFLTKDNGQIVSVDLSMPTARTAQGLKRGSPVTLYGVPVGQGFRALGFIEAEPGAEGSIPAR